MLLPERLTTRLKFRTSIFDPRRTVPCWFAWLATVSNRRLGFFLLLPSPAQLRSTVAIVYMICIRPKLEASDVCAVNGSVVSCLTRLGPCAPAFAVQFILVCVLS